MRLPNPPRFTGGSTGIMGLDRFLQELGRFLADLKAELARPGPVQSLPTILHANLDQVALARTGQLFAVPDHPDGYRIGVSDGNSILWLVPAS